MKKNIVIRVLAALGGVTLWCLGLAALAETFFHAPVTAGVGQLLGARTPVAVLLTLLLAILLCACGVCCLLMLSSKRASKRKGFVMQKGENGVIGVSIKSIEGLVQTCIRQHEVVRSAAIAVVERRDGIVILLDIKEDAGVNIPLAVGALQKQIKQYVNECTGVDVHEVRVMVENTEENVVASPFAVKEPVVMTTAVTAAELQREAAEAAAAAEPAVEVAEEAQEAPAEMELPAEEPLPETEPVQEIFVQEEPAEDVPAEETVAAEEPVVQSAPVVMPVIPEIIEEEDDRPLHQRLFGTEDEPVFVPAPPELILEPQPEAPVEAAPGAEEEPAVEEVAPEEEPQEELAPNAVLEVVEAIVLEEELSDEEPLTDEETFEYDTEVLAEEAILDGAEAGEDIEKLTQED